MDRAPGRSAACAVGRHAATLARVVPEVAARLGAAPREVVEPFGDRGTIHDALHAYLSQVGASHPTLFVVEDLHWASNTTRDALTDIARLSGRAPMLIVATSRDTTRISTAGLATFLAEISRLPSAELVPLTGLDVEAATELLADLGTDFDTERAVHETGGNPLFLRELAASDGISRTLQGFVATRYDAVAHEDLDVVDTATVVGTDFDADVIAAATNRDVGDILDTLERVESAGLVAALAGRPAQISRSYTRCSAQCGMTRFLPAGACGCTRRWPTPSPHGLATPASSGAGAARLHRRPAGRSRGCGRAGHTSWRPSRSRRRLRRGGDPLSARPGRDRPRVDHPTRIPAFASHDPGW